MGPSSCTFPACLMMLVALSMGNTIAKMCRAFTKARPGHCATGPCYRSGYVCPDPARRYACCKTPAANVQKFQLRLLAISCGGTMYISRSNNIGIHVLPSIMSQFAIKHIL